MPAAPPGNPIKLSSYILLSKEERTKHINLSNSCYLEQKKHWKNSKDALLEFLKVEDNIPHWLNGGIHRCHACGNDTTLKRVCVNPEHIYLGTASENALDRPVEKRLAGAKASWAFQKGKETSKETREKIRQGNLGKRNSEEAIKKQRIHGTQRFVCLLSGAIKSNSHLSRFQKRNSIPTSLRLRLTWKNLNYLLLILMHYSTDPGTLCSEL